MQHPLAAVHECPFALPVTPVPSCSHTQSRTLRSVGVELHQAAESCSSQPVEWTADELGCSDATWGWKEERMLCVAGCRVRLRLPAHDTNIRHLSGSDSPENWIFSCWLCSATAAAAFLRLCPKIKAAFLKNVLPFICTSTDMSL